MRQGNLLAVQPDGFIQPVPNTYEGIKAVLGDRCWDFVRFDNLIGAYIWDDALLTCEQLNVTASWFAGQPLYGACVVAACDTDDEGNTLPPPPQAVDAMTRFAQVWHGVVDAGLRIGQDLLPRSDADAVPPPQVIAWSDFTTAEDVLRAIDGDE